MPEPIDLTQRQQAQTQSQQSGPAPTDHGADSAAAQALIGASLRAVAAGLNTESSGSASIQLNDGSLLITPAELPYADMIASDVLQVSADGVDEPGQASAETGLHRAIYAANSSNPNHANETKAIMVFDSPAASAMACLRMDVPPFHEMVVDAGGASIRCSQYAPCGTEERYDSIVSALEDRRACLIANRGQLTIGDTIEDALRVAITVEGLCQRFLMARAAGSPALLSPLETDQVYASRQANSLA